MLFKKCATNNNQVSEIELNNLLTGPIEKPKSIKENANDEVNSAKFLIYDFIKTVWIVFNLIIRNIFFHIPSIVIGFVYLKDCPNTPAIPIILIINGGINLLIAIVEKVDDVLKKRIQFIDNWLDFNSQKWMIPFKLLSFICLIIWIVMSYGSDYPIFKDKNSENYCNKTLFLYSFWTLNATLILSIFMILGTIFIVILIFSIWGRQQLLEPGCLNVVLFCLMFLVFVILAIVKLFV